MITVNLDTQTAYDGYRVLISHGVPSSQYKFRFPIVSFDSIETLYQSYKNSIPANRFDTSRYFYAKKADQLTTDELMCGKNRQNAKEALELAVLEGIVQRQLIWPDDALWFWQSEKDPDLILLKRWFVTQKAGEK